MHYDTVQPTAQHDPDQMKEVFVMAFKSEKDFEKFYEMNVHVIDMMVDDFIAEIRTGNYAVGEDVRLAEKYVSAILPNEEDVTDKSLYDREYSQLLLSFCELLSELFPEG